VIFSPTDPKHKKYENFNPDKLEIWDKTRPGHVQENIWSLGDTVHLHELTTMQEILLKVQKRGPIEEWVCDSILVWWEHHSTWVLQREQLFRKYWIPLCETRFHYPKVLKDACKKYARTIHNISTVIKQLALGDDLKDLLHMWKSYEKDVRTYKAYNDNMGVMLYHAYFSPKDADRNLKDAYTYLATFESIRGSCCANRKSAGYVPSVINTFGEHIFRHVFMKREQFPDFMWDAIFSKQYQQFCTHIVVHIDALLSGNAPILSEWTNQERNFTVNLESFLNLNPLHPEYQKDKRFPPNKLKEWGHELESETRTITNKALKDEIKSIRKALIMVERRGPLEDWELSSIRKCFAQHYAFVTSFYAYTSQVHIPFLETRICLPKIMKVSLDDYIEDIDIIHDLVDSLKVGDGIQELLQTWYSYEEKFSFAVQIHDPMYLILYHAYFSREEHLVQTHKHLKNGSFDDCFGSVIYHFGKDNFRRIVLKQEELSDLTWHFKFGSKYDRYVRDVVIQIEALTSGLPAENDNRAVSKLFSFLETNLSDECLNPSNSKVPSALRIGNSRGQTKHRSGGEIMPDDKRLSELITSLYSEYGKR